MFSPKMLPWSKPHHIIWPLRHSRPFQPSSRARSPQPGIYSPGRFAVVLPYSVTTLGIPGAWKSGMRAPSPLYPATSPIRSILPSPMGRCAPPTAAGRVGSSSCTRSTSFSRRLLTPGMASSVEKKGSLETLHTTIEGLLRLMRIMSVSCCSALCSKASMSLSLTG